MRWRLWHKAVLAVGLFALALIAADRLFPPPLDKVTVSTLAVDYQGRWLHPFPVVGEEGQRTWRFRADLEEIDPRFVEQLVTVEDKRFWSHAGIDPLAVLRATGSLVREREIVSGASTITMQTARLLEPRPRNIGSKFIEMFRALQLEARLTKEEILSLYLTLAPYGGNIEGVRAASLTYFGKEPAQLTDAQIALLIVLPQAPEARRPDRRPAAAKAARARILGKLVAAGALTDAAASDAREAGLPSSRRALPRFAWHAALEQTRKTDLEEIPLTLDKDVQSAAEQLARRHAARAADGANVAVLVVENRNRAVRASVGSAGTGLEGGWIDMTRAVRSPGSTLKPFIYGLAFEDGVAGGRTLINDAPTSFEGYRPENFTRLFHGDVTLSEALQHSLNVPAVLALDRVGPQRFAASLRATGVEVHSRRRADARESLAIALGGVGMDARGLATLYAGLANDGAVAPLSWRADELFAEETYKLFSPQNARRLTRIMEDTPAPAGRSPAALAAGAPAVAFKTGTSYGFRDAWSAGYTEDYTVVVWVGHASGAPRPGITGRGAALPLLFDVFDMLAVTGRMEHDGGAGESLATFTTGAALARLAPDAGHRSPEIVFPENGIEIYLGQAAAKRGFLFSARGGAGAYRWYVDGVPLGTDGLNLRPIWRPPGEGFYEITVVDAKGRASRSTVRVLATG